MYKKDKIYLNKKNPKNRFKKSEKWLLNG